MEHRTFGASGESLSVIGYGAIVGMGETQADSDRYVAEALDAGVDYFDVAPSYGDAQYRLGPSLRGKRNDVFLACKTGKWDGAEARAELEESLRALETDRFDLYQLHAVTTAEDVRRILAPGGALETFVKAKEQGLVRHIGFSTHGEDAAVALFDAYPFASVLFPVNFAALMKDVFGRRTFDAAKRRGAACLALKAMARAAWPDGVPHDVPKAWYQPIPDARLAGLALRYALSRPIVAALPPGDIRLLRLALQTVRDGVRPLDPDELSDLSRLSDTVTPLFPIG